MKSATLTEETDAIVSEDNQITLPIEYLEALALKPGDTVLLRLESGNIQVKKRLSFREAAEKYARHGGGDTLARLRAERGWDEYDAESR